MMNPDSSVAFVDSASINTAIWAISKGSPAKWTLWERDSVLRATFLLIQPQTRIIPGPQDTRPAIGLNAQVIQRLKAIVSRPPGVTPVLRVQAIKHTNNWATRGIPRLRALLTQTKNDPSFEEWMESELRLWHEHVEMNNGLIGPPFIRTIGRILDEDPERLLALDEASVRGDLRATWIKNPSGGEASTVINAFTAALLLRGRFHLRLAETSGFKLSAHAIRKPVLPRQPVIATDQIPAAFHHLIKFMIGSALSQGRGKRAVCQWAENIRTARENYDSLPLMDHQGPPSAEERAYRAARDLHLPMRNSTPAHAINLAVAVGGELGLHTVSLSAGVRVVPGLPTAILEGAQIAVDKMFDKSIGKAVMESPLFSGRRRFRALAYPIPGRLDVQYVGLPASPGSA